MPTSPQFKHCTLGRGWRSFIPRLIDRYPDLDQPGPMYRDLKKGGTTGPDCSNF